MRLLRILAFSLLTILIRGADTANLVPPTSSLLGWWRAEDSPNEEVFAHLGSVQGATYVDGKDGRAFAFDGTDDYMTCPNVATMNFAAGLTVAAWIQELSPAANRVSVIAAAEALGKSWRLEVTGSKLRFIAQQATNAVTFTSAAVVTPEYWTHVAATFNPLNTTNQVRFYVNGAEVSATRTGAETLLSGFDTGTQLAIGARRSFGNTLSPFKGNIDELVLYKRRLSAFEINSLCNLPVVVGRWPAEPINPAPSTWKVAVKDPYAFLADGGNGLRVLSLRNPAAPIQIAQVAVNNAVDVAVKGNLALVADRDFGLRIFDVSNPAAPAPAGSLATGNCYSVAFDDTHVHLAAGTGGYLIVDISNPASPSVTGTHLDGSPILQVFSHLGTGFARTEDNRFLIVDISNPSAPFQKHAYNPGEPIRDFSLYGQEAMLALPSGMQSIYVDIAPQVYKNYEAPDVRAIGTEANYVGLAGAVDFLPGGYIGSQRAARLELPGVEPVKITISDLGERAYLAAGASGMLIVDRIGEVKTNAIGQTISQSFGFYEIYAFEFNATAGQALYFDELNRDTCAGLRWKCIRPDGSVLFEDAFGIISSEGCEAPVDAGRFNITQSGNYRLIFYGGQFPDDTFQFKVVEAVDECVNAPAGLISWWKGDGNFEDSVEHRAASELSSGVTYSAAKVGDGFAMRGNGFLSIPDNPAFAPANISISVWANATAPGNFRSIIAKSATEQRFSYGLHTGNGQGLVFYISDGVDVFESPAAGDIWNGTWRHIVATYDGSFIRLFVDGAQVGSGTPCTKTIAYASSFQNGQLLIGGSVRSDNASFWPGDLDEIMLFNRALTGGEVSALYVANTKGACPLPRIVRQPESRNATLGEPVAFEVIVESDIPVTYQWERNGVPIEGATSWTLSFPQAGLSNQASYRLRVTSAAGSAYSATVSLALWIPVAPVLVGSVDTTEDARAVDVVGSIAYLADGRGGLKIFNVANPAEPVQVGSLPRLSHTWGIKVVGNRAYVAEADRGLRIVDVSDPTNPLHIAEVDTEGNAYAVDVAGDYAYVADAFSGLQVINLNSRTRVAGVDTPGQAYAVHVSGNYAYVADFDQGLRIIDITNPAQPQMVGGLDTPGDAWSVRVSGKRAYLANGTVGLIIMNVSFPQAPSLEGVLDTGGQAMGVQVAGNFAYLADFNGGLAVANILNPLAPSESPGVDTPGDGRGIDIEGGYAYIADGLAGLQVIRIAEAPVAPSILVPPANVTVVAGEQANFVVSAAGTGPFAYQWLRNGSPIENATGSALALNSVQAADNGARFSVRVSNGLGEATSAEAILAVESCAVEPPGLVGWWRGEGNVVDSAGSGNGAAGGALTFGPGKSGQAFQGGYARIPNSAALQPATITLAAWIKGQPPAFGQQHIISKALGEANFPAYGLNVYERRLVFAIAVEPAGAGSLSASVSWDDQWHFVVGTYDGSSVRLYVDGVQVASNAGPPLIYYGTAPADNGDLFIGAGNSVYRNDWPGSIDEVMIFNRGLTPEQVTALYAAGAAGLCPGFSLNVSSPRGTVQRNPDLRVYPPGTQVQLTATPSGGRTFIGWSGDATGAQNPITITMDGNKTITANVGFLVGDKKWEFDTGNTMVIESSPAIASDGTVYFGSYDKKMYALNGATGEKKWDFLTGGLIRSSPALGPDGVVYFGSEDKKLYALDGVTGQKKWEFAATQPIYSSPAVDNDRVYIGSWDFKMYSIRTSDGVKMWDFHAGAQVFSPPAIGRDGTVYFGSYAARCYALDRVTGASKWTSVALSGLPTAGVSLGLDGTVYIGARGSRLYAFDPQTGVKKWEWVPPATLEGTPSVGVDGTVYVGSDAGIHAINGETGIKRWEVLGRRVLAAPAIASDGTLYVGSMDNKLYAMSASDGATQWEFDAGGSILSSPALTADGTVYFGANSGKMFAVQGSAPLAPAPWPRFHQNNLNTGKDAGPAILRHPVHQVVSVGGVAIFSVEVAGGEPVTYQWQFNGVDLPGRTSSTLEFTGASEAHRGKYTVRVTGPNGSITSAPAVLQVWDCAENLQSLVGWWPGEGNASDATGLNPDSVAARSLAYLEGRFGQGFNTANGSVRAQAVAALKPTNITVSAWVKGTPSGGFQTFVSKSLGAAASSYWLGVGSSVGSIRFYVAHESSVSGVAASITWNANWRHVVGSYDGSAVRLYLDGVQVGSAPATLPIAYGTGLNAGDLMIGSTYTNNAAYDWPGGLDEVMIFNQALSLVEIADLFSHAPGACQGPRFLAQPRSQSTTAGFPVEFSVEVADPGQATFQWQFNGVDIPGATAPLLRLGSARLQDAGNYRVVATDPRGSKTSDLAILSVDACGPAPVGLVDWWRGEDLLINEAGDTRGELMNGAAFGAGKIGRAFVLDGINDEISLGKLAGDVGRYDFTIAFWIRRNSSRADETIVSKISEGEPAVDRYLIQTDGAGRIVFRGISSDGAGGSIGFGFETLPLTVGQWHFVAFSRSGNVFQAHLDGISGAPVSFPSVRSLGNHGSLAISRLNPAPGPGENPSRFTGALDELMFFNRALDPAELSSIYSAPNGLCRFSLPPAVDLPLGEESAMIGSAWTLTAAFHGEGPFSYRWYKNGVLIPGASGPTLSIPTINSGDAGDYFVIVSNPFGERASEPARLEVPSLPQIDAPPAPVTVRAGQGSRLRLEVEASGRGPLAYQWFRNDQPIAGATGSRYEIDAPAIDDGGNYRVRVTNAAGSVSTAPILVRIVGPLSISQQPASQSVADGAFLNLSVTASGVPPFSYQWRLNGENIPNANNSTYSVAMSIEHAGAYTVAITDAGGATTSDPALITLAGVPVALAGDDFVDAVELFGSSGLLRVENTAATREEGEPEHAGKAGQHSVWYYWTAPEKGRITFETTGSSFDTLLAVYSGQTLGSLLELASDDDNASFSTSETIVNAEAGARYIIAVDGLGDAAGVVVLAWNFEASPRSVPRIREQPASLTVALNSEARFRINAENAESYQWRFNGVDIPGANGPELVIPSASRDKLGVYDVVVGGGGILITSQQASLQAGSNHGVLAYDKVFDRLIVVETAGAARTKAPIARLISFSSAAPARGVPGIAYQHYASTIQSSRESGEPNHAAVAGEASMWFVIAPEAQGSLEVTTDGSAFDTVLAVYSGFENAVLFRQLTLEGSDDNGGAGGGSSRVVVRTRPGVAYFCAVDGVNGAAGSLQINYRLAAPPVITQSPEPQSVLVGGTFTLNARASNAESSNFQWRLNGVPIQGAIGETMTFRLATAGHAGEYTCAVATFAGSAISAPAIVTIRPAEPLRIGKVSLSGDRVRFRVQGGSALPVRIESTLNFRDWTEIFVETILGGVIDFETPAPTGIQPLFYRVKQ